MNNHSKRILAMALAVLMICALFAGCANAPASSAASKAETPSNSSSTGEEKLDPVKLVVYLNQTAATGDKQVAQAVSNLDEMKAINTTVEFVTIPDGDKFDDKITLVLSSGEDCDVVVGEQGYTYRDRVRAGAYADITELLNTKYTKLKDALLPEHWELATIDGKIYGVSTYKESCNDWGFFISHKFVEEKNIDLKNRNLSNIDDILQALKDDGRETFMLTYSQSTFFTSITQAEKYIILQNPAVVSFDDPKTVVNFYATEDFRNECLKARERYVAGLIDPEILTVENYKAQLSDETRYGLQITNHAPLTELSGSSAKGFDLDFLPLTEMTMMNDVGWITCINAKSKYVDRAMAFLEVWNTESNVKNTITFGMEGVTFDLTDGQVDYTNYPDHAEFWRGDNSRLGNMMISYTLVGEPKDKWKTYQEFGKTARAVPTVGFFVDTSTNTNEISALSAVEKEYHALLCSGTVEDVDGTIDKFNQALEANGLKTLIDEVQKQLNTFYANK